MDSARCQRGMDAPSGNPRQMHRRAGRKRQSGAFSFGYFSFDCMDAGGRAMQEQLPRAAQKKSTSPSGAITRLNKLSRSDSL